MIYVCRNSHVDFFVKSRGAVEPRSKIVVVNAALQLQTDAGCSVAASQSSVVECAVWTAGEVTCRSDVYKATYVS